MLTLKMIKNQADSFRHLMKGRATLHDLSQLVLLGYFEDEVEACVSGEEFVELPELLSTYPVDTKIDKIRLPLFKNLDNPAYDVHTGAISFDVYDEERNADFPFITDATLETIDTLFEMCVV